MKQLLIFCLFIASWLLASSGVIPPIGWEAAGYQYNMTVYAQVLRKDGTAIDADDSILAVFDAYGECRGSITPIDGPKGRLFSLLVSANAVSEPQLCLKVLDATTGEVYLIAETVDFTSDLSLPEDGILNPLQLHVREPYRAEAEIAVAVSGQTESVHLEFAVDDNATDDYSATKDVRTTSDKAFIVATEADEQEIALQKSVKKTAELVRWQLCVKLNAGESATLSWKAFSDAQYAAYLFPDSESPKTVVFERAGEYRIPNDTSTMQEYCLSFVFSMAEGLAVYDFKAGWNLVSFPFVPDEKESLALLALKPFGVEHGTYVKVNALEANVGYWFFNRKRAIYALVRKEHAAMPAMKKDGTSLECQSLNRV